MAIYATANKLEAPAVVAKERSVRSFVLARAPPVRALAGSLDIQGCVHPLHESAHGPRHEF